MGSPRLAQQARSVSAKYKRVLGCALASTQKIGGRDDSRHTFWNSHAEAITGLHLHSNFDFGARDRREYGDIQPHQRVVAQAVAIPRAAAARLDRQRREWHGNASALL